MRQKGKNGFVQTFNDQKLDLDFLGINYKQNCIPQPGLGLKMMSEAYYNISANASCVDALTSFCVEQVEDGNTFKIVPTVDNPDQNQFDRLVRLLTFPGKQSIQEVFTEGFRDLYGGITGNLAFVINDILPDGDGRKTIWSIRHVPSHLIYKAKDKRGWYLKKDKHQHYFNRFGEVKDDENAMTLFYLRVPFRGHDFQGLPNIWKTFDSAQIQDSIASLTRNYFKNGMISTLVYQETDSADDNIEVNQETIRNFFQKSLFGENQQHGLMYMFGDGKFQNLTQKLEADIFDKIIKTTSDQILDIHQMPPRLLGRLASGGGGFETIDDFRIYNFKKIQPSRNNFERDLQMLFGVGMQIWDWRISFNKIDVSPAVSDAKVILDLTSAMTTAISTGLLNKEEAKELYKKTIDGLQLTKETG